MQTVNVKLKYLKDVLGIRQILVSENTAAEQNVQNQSSVEVELLALQLHFDTRNTNSEVLFLSVKNSLGVEELQLLEKIIMALKVPFGKTDIAYLNQLPKNKFNLVELLSKTSYRYVFIQGKELSEVFVDKSWFGNIFEFNNIKYFTSFHPKEMIANPDLKKEAWSFFKTIIPQLKFKHKWTVTGGDSK